MLDINGQANSTTAVDETGLDMDIETVRALGYRIVDIIADELSDPARRPPWPPRQSSETWEAVFGGPLPQGGMEPGELLDTIRDHLLPGASNLAHPRWLGYVLAGSLPLAGLTGALVSTLNLVPYDPANTCLSMSVARWLGEMLGFAQDAAGYMTTGGSWANLVGMEMMLGTPSLVSSSAWAVSQTHLTQQLLSRRLQ